MLGGVYPITHSTRNSKAPAANNGIGNGNNGGGATATNTNGGGGSKSSRVHPISEFGLAAGRLNVLSNNVVNADTAGAFEETPMAASENMVKVSLRIQYLRNAQEYLLTYKDKLRQANNTMRQMENNI